MKLIEVSCNHCGTILKRPAWKVKNNKYNFCDRKCLGSFMGKKSREKRNADTSAGGSMVELICDQCKKPFLRARKYVNRSENQHVFCCRECLATWRSENAKEWANLTWLR